MNPSAPFLPRNPLRPPPAGGPDPSAKNPNPSNKSPKPFGLPSLVHATSTDVTCGWTEEFTEIIMNHELTPEPALPPSNVLPGGDWSSINGTVLCGPLGSLFGVRVGWVEDGVLITDRAFDKQIRRMGACAPGGRFASLSSERFLLTWASDGRLFGRIDAIRDAEIVIECYPAHDFPHRNDPGINPVVGPAFVPFNNFARFDPPHGRRITGHSPEMVIEPGTSEVNGGWLKVTGRNVAVIGDPVAPHAGFFLQVMEDPTDSGHSPTAPGTGFTISHDRSAWFRFRLRAGESVHLVAGTFAPEETVPPEEACSVEKISAAIQVAEEAHARESLSGTGPLAEMAGPMAHELGWLSCWHPFERRSWSGVGRSHWYCDGRYNIWGWDEALSAIIADTFDPALAENNLYLQKGDTRIGACAAWTLYARSGNLDRLHLNFEFLRQQRPPESPFFQALDPGAGAGMDDTPICDDIEEKGPIHGVDMASYQAWNAELMARMATELGREADASAYRERHAFLCGEINDKLWHEGDGIYRNRHLSGEWCPTDTPTAFYPWLAGAVPAGRSARLLARLTDPREFWGEWVIPSISRSHPVYGLPATKPLGDMIMPPYSYWRGAIWPPTCFLVYEGLRRAGHGGTALELATKCVALWRRNWEEFGICPENYHPVTGRITEPAHGPLGPHPTSNARQSWSMLLPFVGIKELIDLEIWDDDPGSLRFGADTTETSSVRNWLWRGHRLDVQQDNCSLSLHRDGDKIFHATGGVATVRHFLIGPEVASFHIRSETALTVEITPWLGEPAALLKLPPGHHAVEIPRRTPESPRITASVPLAAATPAA